VFSGLVQSFSDFMDESDSHEEAETQHYFMDNFITMTKTFISFILFLEVSSTNVFVVQSIRSSGNQRLLLSTQSVELSFEV
jgi:hypothetical protein